jgi:putative transposase
MHPTEVRGRHGFSSPKPLIDAAQTRWRPVNAPQLVALVRAAAVFHKGKLLEQAVDITQTSNDQPEIAGSQAA